MDLESRGEEPQRFQRVIEAETRNARGPSAIARKTSPSLRNSVLTALRPASWPDSGAPAEPGLRASGAFRPGPAKKCMPAAASSQHEIVSHGARVSACTEPPTPTRGRAKSRRPPARAAVSRTVGPRRVPGRCGPGNRAKNTIPERTIRNATLRNGYRRRAGGAGFPVKPAPSRKSCRLQMRRSTWVMTIFPGPGDRDVGRASPLRELVQDVAQRLLVRPEEHIPGRSARLGEIGARSGAAAASGGPGRREIVDAAEQAIPSRAHRGEDVVLHDLLHVHRDRNERPTHLGFALPIVGNRSGLLPLPRREVHGKDRQKRVERGQAQEPQARKGASDQKRAAQKFHGSPGCDESRPKLIPAPTLRAPPVRRQCRMGTPKRGLKTGRNEEAT